jgi:hypothetical protein
MKQFFLFMICSFIITTAMAQMPKAINYQAVARNAQGQALANQNIKVRLSIVSSAAGNPTLYSETRQVTTNALGLFNVQIGSAGATSTTGDFSTINWVNNTTATKSLKVELDINNSGSFTDMGSQSLVTVPYAYAADKAIDAVNIGGHYVDTNTPTTGDVLKWDGSSWVSATPVKVYSVGQSLSGTSAAGGNLAFVFLGNTTEITLTPGQTITTVLSATLGSTGTVNSLGIAPAFQSTGGGNVITFGGSNYYNTVGSISSKSTITVSGVLKVVPVGVTPGVGEINPGTYQIGLAVRNTSATALNQNEALTGFILVQ